MKKNLLILAVTGLIVSSITTNALSLTINGVKDTTTAADMIGMTVDVTYFDYLVPGGTNVIQYEWANLSGYPNDYFGVSLEGGGTLGFSGNSFFQTWDLTSPDYEIENIFIDAGAGNTVFDKTFNNQTGTTGSFYGKSFLWDDSAGNPLGITATYSESVNLVGAAPVGDLFRYLNIEFTGRNFGGVNNSTDSLNYYADTDTVVPEPSTVILMGLGLAGLVGFNRKRNNKKS